MPAPRTMSSAPTTRYRRGVRNDAEVTKAHTDQSRLWRRSLADAEFPPGRHQIFLHALRNTADIVTASALIGVTHNRVYGRMSWDDAFARAVEAVLAKVCRGGEFCGRPKGYKLGGRCAACRAAKR